MKIQCPTPKGHDYAFCYLDSPGTGASFMIGSRWSGNANKVIGANAEGNYKMVDRNDADQNQWWQLSESGNQLVNVATGLPLAVYGQTMWTVQTTANNDYILSPASDTSKALDSYNGNLSTYTMHKGSNQVFYPIFAA